jgi:hypothetical protein
MKHLTIAIVILLLSPFIMAQEETSTSGEVQIETRRLGDFNRVRVSRGINVTLVEDDEPSAEIHIINAEFDDVIIEQSNNELTLRMRPKVYREMAVNVYLKYQTILEISTGTGGSVFSDDIITGDELKLDAGGDSSIQLEVEVNKISATASASRIELTGTANVIDVNLNTAGRFVGDGLKSQEAKVRANTGANARVWVTNKIEASAGSGARIEYYGNPPKVEVRTSLGGRVQEVNDWE